MLSGTGIARSFQRAISSVSQSICIGIWGSPYRRATSRIGCAGSSGAALAVLAAISALIAVSHDWRHIHFRSAVWPVLSSVAGIPLRLLPLKSVPEAGVNAASAGVIIAFSAYSIVCRPRREVTDDGYSWLFGFIAGILAVRMG